MEYYVVSRNGFFGPSQLKTIEGITQNKEDAYKIKDGILQGLEEMNNKYNRLSEIAQQYSDRVDGLTEEEQDRYSDILSELYEMEEDLNTHVCITTYEVSDSGNAIIKAGKIFWAGD